jgi:hypothetical protein
VLWGAEHYERLRSCESFLVMGLNDVENRFVAICSKVLPRVTGVDICGKLSSQQVSVYRRVLATDSRIFLVVFLSPPFFDEVVFFYDVSVNLRDQVDTLYGSVVRDDGVFL